MWSGILKSLSSIDLDQLSSLFRFGFPRIRDEVQSAVPADSQEDKEQKEPTSREKYEEKRKMTGCGFRKDWLSEFIWLDYNEKEGQMHCKVCRDIPNIADKNSSFRRNKSFHVSNIKGHDHSHHHAKCVEAQKAREAPTSTPIRLRLRT